MLFSKYFDACDRCEKKVTQLHDFYLVTVQHMGGEEHREYVMCADCMVWLEDKLLQHDLTEVEE